jgi:hypothetical protein
VKGDGAVTKLFEDMAALELRAWHDKVRAEEARKIGPMLDAMLLEARSLRLAKGHKARERTLYSEEKGHASRNQSQAGE